MSSEGLNFTKTLHDDTYSFIDPITNGAHKGHSVFITGGSKGVGRATAIAYAEAGASHIAIGSRSSQDEVETAIREGAKKGGHSTPTVLQVKLDVADFDSVARAARETEETFGKLDILVNNAGYLEKWLAVGDSDPEQWWYTWEINVRGLYWCTRAFLPLLKKGAMKQIVNLSSAGANRIVPGGSAYQTTKLAVTRVTEYINADHGKDGILAFSVHPGGVPTELAKCMPDALHAVLVDTPELAGHSIAWLTQERREWLAGRYISVNWDMPELLSMREEIVK